TGRPRHVTVSPDRFHAVVASRGRVTDRKENATLIGPQRSVAVCAVVASPGAGSLFGNDLAPHDRTCVRPGQHLDHFGAPPGSERLQHLAAIANRARGSRRVGLLARLTALIKLCSNVGDNRSGCGWRIGAVGVSGHSVGVDQGPVGGSTMAPMAVEKPRYPSPLMPWDRGWTVDDLDALPDDGFRYELIDGTLLVTPPPWPPHQRAVRGLFVALYETCPADLEVFFAPLDFQPDRRNSLEPDVLVVRREDVGVKCIERPLQLAVEVFSPTTRRRDQSLKRSVYEGSGVASYWMFDPEVPSLLVCELVDGRYVDVAKAAGEEEILGERPFPVRLCPAELAEG